MIFTYSLFIKDLLPSRKLFQMAEVLHEHMSLNIDKVTIRNEFYGYRDGSVDCAKIKKFRLQEPSTGRKVSINKLMEEVKPIVIMEK